MLERLHRRHNRTNGSHLKHLAIGTVRGGDDLTDMSRML